MGLPINFTSAQQIPDVNLEPDLFAHLSAQGISHGFAIVDPTARQRHVLKPLPPFAMDHQTFIHPNHGTNFDPRRHAASSIASEQVSPGFRS